jgi:DNA (cytosine-5)-methyltransferase 1
MTTKDQTGLVAPPPFIVNMQKNSLATGMTDPLQTLLTGSHRYLAAPASIEVEDCGFRMLEPHECQTAMAFPDSYIVTGTRRERVRQLGNAVTPPVMEILMERVMETFR